MLESETLKPMRAITQAVVVVPRFAPIITPIASFSVSSPALTKLTTITVVSDDDCTAVVISVPDIIPLKRLPVIVRMTLRNFSPETF